MAKPKFLLTRGEVAKQLGVHISTVRRMEKRRELHSVRDRNGIHRFDAKEVANLAAKRGRSAPLAQVSGPLAARVYKAMHEGKTIDHIVIETELAPEQVLALCAHFNKTPTLARKQSEERKTTRGLTPAESDDDDAAYKSMLRELERDEARRRRR
jgi:excisionase family DNA binding protein